MLIRLSTCSCLKIGMHDVVTVERVTVPLEGWKNLNIWEWPLKNQTSTQEEIKNWLKSGNACYYLVQNHLSSSLLSKNVKNEIHRVIILPVVLYRCKTWSLGVFENRVLRRISGPKWDEVTGEWRKLHNEELNDLYSSPNIVRVIKSSKMKWIGHLACIGRGERCTQGFGGETWKKETTWKTQA
jgi:hypothetical protein